MNLPIFNTLLKDQSTYITFSKALLDYDYAEYNSTEYYFSKMVAINLPDYKNGEFFIFPEINQINGLSGQINTNGPNFAIPKGMQYYMENIIRQTTNCENITELAFYKFLNKCGISYQKIRDEVIVFVNQINTENFTKSEYNNGWGEIVMQIPNNSKKLIKAFKQVDINNNILADVVNGNDDGIFDNGSEKSFDFSNNDSKKVIDFDNLSYDDTTRSEFKFNCILVFYKDKDGIDKLHGINFIGNFELKNVTEWKLPTFTQYSNDAKSVGYLFKMNIKTCNNPVSLININRINNSDSGHWNTYFESISKFNSFLELHKTELLKK